MFTRQTTDKVKIEAALTNEGIFTTYLTNAAGESENDYQAELRSNCGEPS
jgi:ribonucleotide monophosphatase NagD (HAD superfamily)